MSERKKRVYVLIPFMVGKKLYKAGTKAELRESVVERLLEINPNMLLVSGDVEEK